jgi:hypothetical protein
MNKLNTINRTLTFSKNHGKLWKLDDVVPYYKKFQTHFDEKMGHDLLKLTVGVVGSQVLDILSEGVKEMSIELVTSDERVKMPGYVEFELVDTGYLASKYYVNNCPGMPQLEAWMGGSVREIIKSSPQFAYIKKVL